VPSRHIQGGPENAQTSCSFYFIVYKGVYSGFSRLSANTVTGCGQRVGMNVIPARVWETYVLGVLHQQVIGYRIALEYSEALVI
jgi:hypothetical protein